MYESLFPGVTLSSVWDVRSKNNYTSILFSGGVLEELTQLTAVLLNYTHGISSVGF